MVGSPHFLVQTITRHLELNEGSGLYSIFSFALNVFFCTRVLSTLPTAKM
ncbi:hypothetical protein COLO4_12785 [Corchorus olitorius]|uniref:Uncharacterized protein n=1 Tax=Corchorus olitorius TaxID=93759 RepID=A0A1R3JZP4_9ROSI|nr:hypothetical protein COLO4_12785 [Corchorus olitorius]